MLSKHNLNVKSIKKKWGFRRYRAPWSVKSMNKKWSCKGIEPFGVWNQRKRNDLLKIYIQVYRDRLVFRV